MSHPDLTNLARRPIRYWTIDGVPELMLGVLWIVWGGAWVIGQQIPHEWPWRAYWLVVAPALALSGLAFNASTRALKERITFPRAGYVAWRRPEGRAAYRMGAAIVLVAAAVALFTRVAGKANIEHLVPTVLSVILALSFVAASIRSRTPHHLALAGATVVLSVAVTIITSGWNAMNWLFVSLGFVCVLVGSIRLARFLRAHPLPEVERS